MKIDYAYRYVKRKIIDGVWQPNTAINVNELAKTLGMSKTPIHKALNKLEQEGFLMIIPQVGVFVKEPDMQEVYERLLVCANLDALLTEQAVPHLTENELNQLKELLKVMDRPGITNEEYFNLNMEFHSTIYRAANLTFIFNLAKQLWEYLVYVGDPEQMFTEEHRKQSQTEHWMIYYQLVEKNSKMAKRLMEDHMRRLAQHISRNYHESNEKPAMSMKEH